MTPDQMLSELLKLNEDAKKSKDSIALEDAFDNKLLERWIALRDRIKKHLANRPS